MVKKVVIYLILLGSASFFNIVFLPSRFAFLLQFAITAMILVVLVVKEIYGKGETVKQNFRNPLFLIFTGVFLSMIIAQAYHHQSYIITAWAQRSMYYYLFYFFLHFLKPDIKDIEKIILTVGVVYAISYLIQFIIFPTILFDVRQDVERGTIRIFIPGSSFMSIALFYCLNRFYTTNKLYNVFLVLLFLSILILQGTRNSLAATFLAIILSLIFSQVIRSRYVIYFLIVLSIIPVFVLFQDIFQDMMELSQRQSRNFEGDVRVRAAIFYLTDFFPNALAYIFGNGEFHGSSIYGMRIFAYQVGYGFYHSDIGIIGEFSKYGLFFLVGVFMIFYKIFRAKLKPEYIYIKYYMFRTLLVIPFGSSFTAAFSVATICVLLYIIDKSNYETIQKPGTDSG